MEKVDKNKLPTWLYIEKWAGQNPYYNVHWGELNSIHPLCSFHFTDEELIYMANGNSIEKLNKGVKVYIKFFETYHKCKEYFSKLTKDSVID